MYCCLVEGTESYMSAAAEDNDMSAFLLDQNGA